MSKYVAIHVFLWSLVCCVYVYIPGNLRVQYNLDNQNGIPVCKRYSRACYIIECFVLIYMYVIKKKENQNYDQIKILDVSLNFILY